MIISKHPSKTKEFSFRIYFPTAIRNHPAISLNLFIMKNSENGIEIPEMSSKPESRRNCFEIFMDRTMEFFLIITSMIPVIATFPFSLLFCLKIVNRYESAAAYRFGRARDVRGKSVIFVIPFVDKFHKMNKGVQSFSFYQNKFITKDGISVDVRANILYGITDIQKIIGNVADYKNSIRLLANASMGTAFRTINSESIWEDGAVIEADTLERMKIIAEKWGIDVINVSVYHMEWPLKLKNAFIALAEEKAKVVAAQEELKAADALKEVAQIYDRFPGAMQIRYFQMMRDLVKMFPAARSNFHFHATNSHPPRNYEI